MAVHVLRLGIVAYLIALAIALLFTLDTGLRRSPAVRLTREAASVPSGSLIFLADGNTNLEVYRADLRSGGLVNLSNDPSTDWEARPSPDGELIAFSSYRDGQSDIYVMSPDGTNVRNLTSTPDQSEAFVSWSPDGERMLFGFFTETTAEYWIMNRDASERGMILPNSRSCGISDWSPNSDSLVGSCTNVEAHTTRLFVRSIDDSTERTLAEFGLASPGARWSPSGELIAYKDRGERGAYEVKVIAPTGGLPALLRASARVSGMSWAPSGDSLALGSSEGLVVADVSSGASVTLDDRDGVYDVLWSPDGQRIAYTLNDGSQTDVYVIRADGTGLANVSDSPWQDYDIAWSPDSESLTFRSDRDSLDGFYALPPDTSEPIRISFEPVEDIQDPPVDNLLTGCLSPGRFGGSSPTCTSPDGRWHAWVRDGVVSEINEQADESLQVIPSGVTPWPARPTWSPESARLAFYGSDDPRPSPAAKSNSAVYVMEIPSGTISRLAEGDAFANSTVALQWSPDGAYVYYLRGGGCAGGCWPGYLYRTRADGSGEPQQLTEIRVLTLYGFTR